MLSALQALYFVVRRHQFAYSQGSPRANPMLVLVIIITPVIYSLLRIIPFASTIDIAAHRGYFSNASPLYYVAAAVAGLTIFFAFDQRRDFIDSKFRSLPKLGMPAQVVVVLGAYATGALLVYLSFQSSAACVTTFLALLAIISVGLRFRPA